MGKRVVFRGKYLTVRQWRQRLPDGRYVMFEQALRPNSVVVLPVDNQGRLVAIRERRFGERRIIWNVPSGKVERSQTALAAAKAELAEEALLSAKHWRRVGGEDHSSSIVSWRLDVFLARGLTPATPKHPDPFEQTRPVVLPLRRAATLALAGRFGFADVAFWVLRLHHERRRWLT